MGFQKDIRAELKKISAAQIDKKEFDGIKKVVANLSLQFKIIAAVAALIVGILTIIPKWFPDFSPFISEQDAIAIAEEVLDNYEFIISE